MSLTSWTWPLQAKGQIYPIPKQSRFDSQNSVTPAGVYRKSACGGSGQSRTENTIVCGAFEFSFFAALLETSIELCVSFIENGQGYDG